MQAKAYTSGTINVQALCVWVRIRLVLFTFFSSPMAAAELYRRLLRLCRDFYGVRRRERRLHWRTYCRLPPIDHAKKWLPSSSNGRQTGVKEKRRQRGAGATLPGRLRRHLAVEIGNARNGQKGSFIQRMSVN